MKPIRKKQVYIFLSSALLLIWLLTYLSSVNNSSHTTPADVAHDIDKGKHTPQEKESVPDNDLRSPVINMDSHAPVMEASSLASNDYRIISFIHTVASNVSSDVIRLLKGWELSTAEYFNPPAGDPEHTLFLFLPPPDDELNRQVDITVLTAFEKYGMDPLEIDAEVVNAVKGLVEWPQGNRILLANADENMEGSVIVFENVSDEMVNEIRNAGQGQYNKGFVIDSSMMKLKQMNFVKFNRYSHLYDPIE
jgi:hypothetical protein